MLQSFCLSLRRELWKMLVTPLAAAMLVFYLLLSGVATLTLGGFIEGNSASLNGFFPWQPWLFLFLCAALSMGTWAEEYRSGTAETLLCLPIPPRTLVLAKFAAGLLLLCAALLCTAPFPVTCAILGEPDWGPVATGYLGCLLAGAFFLALGQWASILSGTQFVSFLLALLLGLMVMLAGFQPTNLLLLKWGVSPEVLRLLSRVGVSSHFEPLAGGRVALKDLAFFLCGAAFFLLLTALRLRQRHAAPGKRRAASTLALCLALLALPLLLERCPWQWDCTQDKLYTLDQGSLQILRELRHPVEVTLVFSQNHPELSSVVRRHAAWTRELLREFAARSHGKLRVREFVPDTSDQQDLASSLGMAPRIGSLGDLWFLGIQASPESPEAGQTAVLPWLDPEEAPSLECQLARAIAFTQRREKRKLGLFSTLTLLETPDPEKRVLLPTWWTIQRLEEEFQLVVLDPRKPLPDGLDAVLLVHPKELSPEFAESLVDFHRNGGGLFLALDPLSQVEMQQNNGLRPPRPSLLPAPLAELWGVDFPQGVVLADRTLASPTTNTRKGLETLPTVLTLKEECLADEAPVTADLRSLTLACPGEFLLRENGESPRLPLARTTTDAQRLKPYQARRDAAAILTDFQPDGTPHVLALEIPPANGAGGAILVADADWLYDPVCVNKTTDAQGREREIPLNDNANFLLNALEHLCGDDTLLRLRTRGIRRRTFTILDAWGREVEEKLRELEAQAYQDNADLRARGRAILQGKNQDDPEVQRQLDDLKAEDDLQQQELKKKQRALFFQLRQRLNGVVSKVAFWNLLLTPALLTLLAALMAWRRRR
ncbi:MAG: Gldg family protein [Oligosphaeraceae bacterium]